MNFGGNEVVYNYQESGIIIVPVPYDETSTWMKGADKGPDAILEASVNLEFYDIETSSEAHLKGIYTVDPVLEKETPEKLVNDVYDRILITSVREEISGYNRRKSYCFNRSYKSIFRIFMKIFQFFSLMLMPICGRNMKDRNLIMPVQWQEHGNLHRLFRLE